MRNDANDDFDNVPSLRADTLDDDDFVPTAATSVRSRNTPVVKVKSASKIGRASCRERVS